MRKRKYKSTRVRYRGKLFTRASLSKKIGKRKAGAFWAKRHGKKTTKRRKSSSRRKSSRRGRKCVRHYRKGRRSGRCMTYGKRRKTTKRQKTSSRRRSSTGSAMSKYEDSYVGAGI
jgi:hypothetical protein